MFKDEEYKNEFEGHFKIHKKTGDVIIQPNKIMSCHKDWAVCNNINNYKIDFRLMKGLLDKIGINSKEMKIGGTKTMYYVFKLETLRAKLIDLNIDDGDVEVYEEDDFE